jgi:hypothetical protein
MTINTSERKLSKKYCKISFMPNPSYFRKSGFAADCLPSQEEGWGWCLPQCSESNLQASYHATAHEAAVDAFVYENCSKGVDTHTEFCTGVPITSALGQIWTVDTTGAGSSPVFTFRRNQLRQFKADLPWNGNGTILRPGAEYQGAQHTQARAPHARSDLAKSVTPLLFYDSEIRL